MGLDKRIVTCICHYQYQKIFTALKICALEQWLFLTAQNPSLFRQQHLHFLSPYQSPCGLESANHLPYTSLQSWACNPGLANWNTGSTARPHWLRPMSFNSRILFWKKVRKRHSLASGAAKIAFGSGGSDQVEWETSLWGQPREHWGKEVDREREGETTAWGHPLSRWILPCLKLRLPLNFSIMRDNKLSYFLEPGWAGFPSFAVQWS